MKIQVKEGMAETVAKRALYLAYQVSSIVGMGVFQAKGGMTEDQVWEDVVQSPGRIHADYVYGRMMKLGIDYGSDYVEVRDIPPRSDYQSWSHEYPTFEALIRKAIEQVEAN